MRPTSLLVYLPKKSIKLEASIANKLAVETLFVIVYFRFAFFLSSRYCGSQYLRVVVVEGASTEELRVLAGDCGFGGAVVVHIRKQSSFLSIASQTDQMDLDEETLW